MILNNYSKKFITYGIGQAFNLISPILVLPYLVKVCGEDGFGKIGVGFSISFILIVIIDFSSYHSGLKNLVDFKDNQEKIKNILIQHLIAKMLLFLVVVCIIFILMIIPYLRDQFKLLISSLIIVFSGIWNPNWILQAQEKFLGNSIFNISSKLIYLLTVFVFINSKELYFLVPLLYGIGIIIPSIFYWKNISKIYQIKLTDFNLIKGVELIKKDYKLCLSQLFFAFRQYSPVMVIDFVLGSFVAGQFRIIEQIVMIFRTFFQILFRFSFSVICNLITTSKEKGILLWKKINVLSIVFVIILLLIIYWNDLLFLKFFNFNTSDRNLLTLFNFSLLIPLLIGINLAMEQLLFSFNKIRVYNNITYLITLFSFVLVFLLSHYLQLFGALLGLMVTEIILIVIYLKNLWPNFIKK